MLIGSLCSGSGMFDRAIAAVFGGDHAWFAESDPAAALVLATRFPGVPNLGDITAVDWVTVPRVDVLGAGFSCQDVSSAGRRAGLGVGTRSGVWTHVARAIGVLRPSVVVLENVPGLLSTAANRDTEDPEGNDGADSDLEPADTDLGNGAGGPVLRAAGAVLGDLADLGYDATWTVVSAADVGAAHLRRRVFIIATADVPGVGHGDAWPAGREELAAAAVGGAVRPDRADADLSLLPTPAARVASRGAGWGDQPGRPLSETILRLLPTPTAGDGTSGPGNGGREGAPNLRTEVTLLPTPWASEGAHGGPNQRGSSGDLTLSSAVHLLPTPAARLADRRGQPNADTAARRMYDEGRRNLEDALALLPTPVAHDTGRSADDHLAMRTAMGRNSVCSLAVAAQLLPTPTVADSRGSRNATAERTDPKPTTQTEKSWTLSDVAYAGRWGQYAPAIARWEQVTGRPAPDPTEPGTRGQPRLSARFVEWLQGWPDGWVTDLVKREDALRIGGNGVVPQQAAYAISLLIDLHSTAVAS